MGENPSGNMTWYRGESTAAPAAKPGGHLHDFGDGVYFTSDKAVAEQYAKTRVYFSGGDAKIYEVTVTKAGLGNVLDLNADPRWRSYISTPAIPGRMDTTPEAIIRNANETYNRFFNDFLAVNKIDIKKYDAVIGPEFVRGGSQLGILHKNGQVSAVALRIRAAMVPAGSAPAAPPVNTPINIPSIPGDVFMPKSRFRRAAGVQGAAAAAGVALGAGIQWLGDVGIQRQVEKALNTTHAEAIRTILSRGDGVLAIIHLQEWERPNDIGMRARGYLGVSIQSGATQADALARWNSQDHLLAGPASGWRPMTQYVWIAPAQE